MAEIKRKLKAFFTNDIYSKALALLFAVMLWFVFGMQNPDIERTLRNIPIDVVNTGGTGLTAVNGISKRAEVTIKGKRSTLSEISSADMYAFVDISSIETPGEYTLDVYIKSTYDDSVVITRKNPESVTVVLDRVTTKEVPVRVEFANNLPDNYVLDHYTVSQDVIMVTGPAEELLNLSYAQATVTLADVRTSFTANAQYTFYTEKDEAVVLVSSSTDISQVTVDVTILKQIELPLAVTLLNNFYEEENVKVSILPETIIVAGEESLVDSLKSLEIGSVDVSQIDESQEYTFLIHLPENVKNISEVTSARVKVDVVSVLTRIINVSDIVATNVPEGMTVEILSESIEVRIRGNNAVINSVTAENLKVTVDLSDLEATAGDYEIDATVEVVGVDQVTVIGAGTVRILLAEEEPVPEVPPEE